MKSILTTLHGVFWWLATCALFGYILAAWWLQW